MLREGMWTYLCLSLPVLAVVDMPSGGCCAITGNVRLLVD